MSAFDRMWAQVCRRYRDLKVAKWGASVAMDSSSPRPQSDQIRALAEAVAEELESYAHRLDMLEDAEARRADEAERLRQADALDPS